MKKIYRLLLPVFVGLVLLNADITFAASENAVSRPSNSKLRKIPLHALKMTGDFDEMLAKRAVRVAVPYSRSLYYIDKGQEQGLVEQYLSHLVGLRHTPA